MRYDPKDRGIPVFIDFADGIAYNQERFSEAN